MPRHQRWWLAPLPELHGTEIRQRSFPANCSWSIRFLRFLTSQLPVFFRGEVVPDCLIIDLRGKRIGEKIRVSEIHLNEGVTLRNIRTDDFSVAKIMGSKKLSSAEEDAAKPAAAGGAKPAAAAGGAKPAAGAKAATPAPAAAAPKKK